jgi:hypothetical protein
VVRDAVVAAVNSVAARVVAVAETVASSVVDAVVVRVDVDAVKPVAAVDVVETSPAPTLPTRALSPASAHKLDTLLLSTKDTTSNRKPCSQKYPWILNERNQIKGI